jgi:hypothetical protein
MDIRPSNRVSVQIPDLKKGWLIQQDIRCISSFDIISRLFGTAFSVKKIGRKQLRSIFKLKSKVITCSDLPHFTVIQIKLDKKIQSLI